MCLWVNFDTLLAITDGLFEFICFPIILADINISLDIFGINFNALYQIFDRLI